MGFKLKKTTPDSDGSTERTESTHRCDLVVDPVPGSRRLRLPGLVWDVRSPSRAGGDWSEGVKRVCKPYRGVCDGPVWVFSCGYDPKEVVDPWCPTRFARWVVSPRESHPPRPETRTDGPSFSGEQNLCGTRGFPNVSVEYY